jgi:hypothetical protein
MAVRTFYWRDRVIGRTGMWGRRLLGRNVDRCFRVGNAGDIFNRDLIHHLYGQPAVNVAAEGRRLLCIGSIAHRILPGDVICGIGARGERIPSARESPCQVRAVRGPITAEVFAAAGHDLSGLRSQLDPGLFIRFLLPRDVEPVKGRVAFVPHYRERALYRRDLPKGVELIDIDGRPTAVGRSIQRAELVLTSSLHGLIFAHALGRPAVLVAPRTPEPLLKYEDYHASVGLTFRAPPTLQEALRGPTPTSPSDVAYSVDDFAFPTLHELASAGIVE